MYRLDWLGFFSFNLCYPLEWDSDQFNSTISLHHFVHETRAIFGGFVVIVAPLITSLYLSLDKLETLADFKKGAEYAKRIEGMGGGDGGKGGRHRNRIEIRAFKIFRRKIN